jgi:hypothetical protein
MPKLRFIAATLAACLCALGLSVGAALAESEHAPKANTKSAEKAAKGDSKGLCLFRDLGVH